MLNYNDFLAIHFIHECNFFSIILETDFSSVYRGPG